MLFQIQLGSVIWVAQVYIGTVPMFGTVIFKMPQLAQPLLVT